MVKKEDECIIMGTITTNNCYQMNDMTDSFSMIEKVHDIELWHRRLGHVNNKLTLEKGDSTWNSSFQKGVQIVVWRLSNREINQIKACTSMRYYNNSCLGTDAY